jgi:Tfp pilus assembly protein PilX
MLPFKRSSNGGFALLIVLIFLQIFSLLGLYSMTASLLMQKMTFDYWVHSVSNSVNSHSSQADIKGKYNPNLIGR